MKRLFLTLFLSSISSTAFAARALMEGTTSQNQAILVDTNNTRVDISGGDYKGTIANVGLYVSSNAVFGSGNGCTIYSTGTLNCPNITQAGAGASISGSGTTNTISKFTGASSIGNSQITDNGSNVTVGAGTNGGAELTVFDGGSTEGIELGTFTTHLYGRIGENSRGNMALTSLAAADVELTPGGTPALIARQSGNVGIGTTNPQWLEHVEGGASASANQLCWDRSGTGIQGCLEADNGGWGIFNPAAQNGIYLLATSSATSFYTNNGERMRIDKNGNVGIGTTNPGQLLQVTAQSGHNFEAIFTSPDFNTATNTGSSLVFYQPNTSGDMYSLLEALKQGTNAHTDLILQGFGGNLGVGQTSPSNLLDVNGGIATRGIGSVGYSSDANPNGFCAPGQCVWAKSIDGASQSAGCVVAVTASAMNASAQVEFTSTTTLTLNLPGNGDIAGVLMETCAPGAICRVDIAGIQAVGVDSTGIGGGVNQYAQFSSTRCKIRGENNGPDAASIGMYLDNGNIGCTSCTVLMKIWQ